MCRHMGIKSIVVVLVGLHLGMARPAEAACVCSWVCINPPGSGGGQTADFATCTGLAVAACGTGNISTVSCAEKCTADIAGVGGLPDGQVNPLDLAVLLGSWGQCPEPDVCGPGAGDCCAPHGTPGCEDVACCQQVCAADPFCCENQWDGICASEAMQLCPGVCQPSGLEIQPFQPGACCLGPFLCLEGFDVFNCAQNGGSFLGPESTCHPLACAPANKCKFTQTGPFAPVNGCPPAQCGGPGAGSVYCSTDTCPPAVCPPVGPGLDVFYNCPGGGQCAAPATSNGCVPCP